MLLWLAFVGHESKVKGSNDTMDHLIYLLIVWTDGCQAWFIYSV